MIKNTNEQPDENNIHRARFRRVLSSDVSVESRYTINQEAFPNLIVPDFLLKFPYKVMID